MSSGIGLGMTLGSVDPQTTDSLVVGASGYYFDFRTAAGYTLSGTNVLTIVERRTGTSIAADSSFATFQETGLSGGPCINFTDDPYTTTLAGLLAVAADNNRYSVIVSGSFTNTDFTGFWCVWTGTTARASVGQNIAGSGVMRISQTNNAGTLVNASTTNTPDANHHVYRYEIHDAGATFNGRFYTDGVEDSGGAKSFAKPTTLTPTAFVVGGITGSFARARVDALIIVPGDPNLDLLTAIEATL